MDHVFYDVPLVPGLALDCLPNRDSMSYGSTYDLQPSQLETMFRGTLRYIDDTSMTVMLTSSRYKGFTSLMRGFTSAGLLDSSTQINLNQSGGWQSLLAHSLSIIHGISVKNDRSSLMSALRNLMLESEAIEVIEAAEW